MPTSTSERHAQRPFLSRAVHRLDDLTTRPTMAIAVAVTVAIVWIVVAATGFDAGLQLVFGNVCASVTVVMVFVLQHTQRREQLALQLKVDELVHATPQADERLVAVEASTDDELLDLEERRFGHHRAARDGHDPGPSS